MKITSRTYTGLDDLERMKHLLIEGRKVHPHSGYAHIGDLNWWLFYNTSGHTPEEIIRLWEDEQGRLVGWSFATLRACEADLFVHPDLRGTPYEEVIVTEIEDQLIELARRMPDPENKGRTIGLFADADEMERITILEKRGYAGQDYLAYFTQPLTGPIPEPCLPDGFRFLDRMRTEYADLRADVHFNSFNPSRMTGDYYRGFMQAPDYDPALDVVVIAPDGRFASFAMGWIDPVNKISVFEPVGTRNEFQRRGLGRATLYEGLRRLQARGMETATVCSNANHPGNVAFYESAGFRRVNTLRAYRKFVIAEN